MPLSTRFTVISADPHGMGLSDKTWDGFDALTPANDMFSLMNALGHQTFSLAGHDVGMWIAFAMAADRPERIARVALGEAIIPGVFPTPPAIRDDYESTKAIWQNVFNRMRGVNERLVEGREEAYFGFEFKNESADAMPAYAREFYIEMLRREPGVLKGSFDYYRGMDASIPQYRALAEKGLRMPVLSFAAEYGCGVLVTGSCQSWRQTAALHFLKTVAILFLNSSLRSYSIPFWIFSSRTKIDVSRPGNIYGIAS